jgi:hypothetical protein
VKFDWDPVKNVGPLPCGLVPLSLFLRKIQPSPGSLPLVSLKVATGRSFSLFEVMSSVSSQPADHEQMKKQSTKRPSTSTATTSVNLEARFEAGEDVLDYFDVSRAVVSHGRTRQGAGRKPTGKMRKTVKLSPAAVNRFKAYARLKKLPSFSAALEAVSYNLGR